MEGMGRKKGRRGKGKGKLERSLEAAGKLHVNERSAAKKNYRRTSLKNEPYVSAKTSTQG